MERFLLIAGLIGASGTAALASASDLELMQISGTAQTMSRDEGGRELFIYAGVPVYPLLDKKLRLMSETPRTWIFGMKAGSTDDELRLMSAEPEFQGTGNHTYPGLGEPPFVMGMLTEGGMRAVLDRYSGSVTYVEEDMLQSHVFDIIDDNPVTPPSSSSSSITYPWGVESLNAHTGRPRGGGANVFVFDTGVRISHTDFGGRAYAWADYIGGFTDCTATSASCAGDVHGHGTHCAGTAVGTLYGVASAATVWAVKILDDTGSGWNSNIVSGLTRVLSNAPRPAVVSMSLSGSGTSSSMENAIDPLVSDGVTVVVAAGNQNSNANSYYPGNIPSAINVASYDSANCKSGFSNYGPLVDIWAPGSGVLSAYKNSDTDTKTMSGTSMACPHVAGLAAIQHEDPTFQNKGTAVRWALLTLHNRGANPICNIPTTYGEVPNLVALAPSVTEAPTPAPDGVSGVGDPHLTNMYGEHFDLYSAGAHVLLQIPRSAGPENTLLRLEADARRVGDACSEVYFQRVAISGEWTNRSSKYEIFANSKDKPNSMKWTRFEKVDLKVVNGSTHGGINYLNVFARHLGNAGCKVGGLLGVGDADIEAKTPDQDCVHRVSLSVARARD